MSSNPVENAGSGPADPSASPATPPPKLARISVVVADDHPLVRQAMRAVLEADPDIAVVGEVGDGLEAVRLVESLQPDVLLLDLILPGLTGLDVVPIVRQRSPRTHIVIFSGYADEELVLQALRGGAIAYVLKGGDPSHARIAVQRASAGRPYFGPELVERAFSAYLEKARSAPAAREDTLTPREREVLQLVAEGLSNAQVAKRLSLSRRTVEMHRANAMRKLGLKTHTDLIRYAIRRGMIPERD
jgi:DNA-binding NarL/FixJ family response regulator